MTEAERERVAIVAWLRDSRVAPAGIHSWADRLWAAWWGLRNPNVFFVAARLHNAEAIERGAHIPTPAQSTEGER